MESLRTFMTNLSIRFRRENDLSDITWAMCQTSPIFKKDFLQFFFPYLNVVDVDLQREWSEDDSRPDFYFQIDETPYIIECKIYDKNHHFEQYVNTFRISPQQLGYITNYNMAIEGFKVHSWKELYNYLQKRIPQEESQIWTAYLDYLKNVCNLFINGSAMNLNGMSSLYTFYMSLDEIFTIDNDRYSCCLYDSRRDTNNGGNFTGETPREGVIGKYFELSLKNASIEKSWGWMGVYFNHYPALVCVGFDERKEWGKPVYDKLKTCLKQFSSGYYSKVPYKELNAIWFEFDKGEEFDRLNTPQEQIALLKKFLEEVLDFICSLN